MDVISYLFKKVFFCLDLNLNIFSYSFSLFDILIYTAIGSFCLVVVLKFIGYIS